MATMNSKSGDSVRARASLEKERLKRKTNNAGLTPVKAYLVAYNLVSASLWGYLLYLTLAHFVTATPSRPPASLLTRFFSPTASSLPQPVVAFIERLSNAYDYKNLGRLTKHVQSVAVLEVVHSGLGLVRSPVGTTTAQVASRLWTVWGVVEARSETHSNPLFSTMLFAWSLTEVIRYTFYALSLLDIDVPFLNYLRYTTFLPLYPLGASSEAFLAFSTLPPLSTLPFAPTGLAALSPLSMIIDHLPEGMRKGMVKTTWGRAVLWNLAKAGTRAKSVAKGGVWGARDYLALGLFVVWWPALYVLYTHMLKQRRKFFSKGKTVSGRNKAQ